MYKKSINYPQRYKLKTKVLNKNEKKYNSKIETRLSGTVHNTPAILAQ